MNNLTGPLFRGGIEKPRQAPEYVSDGLWFTANIGLQLRGIGENEECPLLRS